MSVQTYCLIQDDDAHWYVIPAKKLKATESYFRKVYHFWHDGKGDLPPEPSWLVRVGGSPSSVKFTSYVID